MNEARQWYERAARANASNGWHLARFYAQGIGGLPQDFVKAADWVVIAAVNGSYDAKYSLVTQAGVGIDRALISAIQHKLIALGLFAGPASGTVDSTTLEALKRLFNPLETELTTEQIIAAR
jgi:TPR repeat protein